MPEDRAPEATERLAMNPDSGPTTAEATERGSAETRSPSRSVPNCLRCDIDNVGSYAARPPQSARVFSCRNDYGCVIAAELRCASCGRFVAFRDFPDDIVCSRCGPRRFFKVFGCYSDKKMQVLQADIARVIQVTKEFMFCKGGG